MRIGNPTYVFAVALLFLYLGAALATSDCDRDVNLLADYQYVDANVSLTLIHATGLTWGEVGKYETCEDNAHGRYCQVLQGDYINYGLHPRYMGMCVPHSCNGETLLSVINSADASIHVQPPPPRRLPDIILALGRSILSAAYEPYSPEYLTSLQDPTTRVHCEGDESREMDTAAKCAVALVLTLTFLALVGTLLDAAHVQTAMPFDSVTNARETSDFVGGAVIYEREFADDATSPVTDEGDDDRFLDIRQPEVEFASVVSKNSRQQSTALQAAQQWVVVVCKSFSASSNLSILFEPSDADFKFLHGVRVLSVAWIILAHTLLYMTVVGFDDPAEVLPPNGAYSSFLFQIVPSGVFSVDTFFFMSGFLVSLSLISLLSPGKFNTGLYFVHRIVRLLPPYAMCLFLYSCLMQYIGKGPYMYRAKELTESCDTYWWTSLVFINNVYPTNLEDVCFHWGWYIACDMQFYWLSPLLVYLYRQNRIRGIMLPILICLGSVVSLVVVFVLQGYSPSVFAEDFESNVQSLYMRPWIRCHCYLLGLCLGYWCFEHQQKTRVVAFQRPRHRRFGWFLFLMMCFLLAWPVFSTYDLYQEVQPSWSTLESTLYGALSRVSWGLGLACLFMLCILWPDTSFLARLLSSAAWVPLSRLSYSAFLIHPIYIFASYLNRVSPFHYDRLSFASLYAGNLTFSFAFALLLYLLVERPVVNLERAVVNYTRRRKLERSRSVYSFSQGARVISDVTYEHPYDH
eukprot:Rmarinus@m.20093